MGFWGTTGLFMVLEALVVAFIMYTGRKGQNQLKLSLGTTAVVCMWLQWAIIYMAQMNPLVNPVLTGEE